MISVTNGIPSVPNDAIFRLWGQSIGAMLTAAGLVQTADTGQIDWATVIRGTVTSTPQGYEIWRFNDSLQATAPVYLKLEYGTGQFSPTNQMTLFLTVGTGTNGAGTLTGQVGVRRLLHQDNNNVGQLNYFSGAPNRVAMVLCLNQNSDAQYCMFLVERTKLADGTETADGIVVYSVSGQANSGGDSAFQVIPFSGIVPAWVNANMAVSPNLFVSQVIGSIGFSPVFCPLGKPLFASWLIYVKGDIGPVTAITLNHLGRNRVYLPLGPGAQTGLHSQGGVNNTQSILIPWE